jgi:hypothetical protein
MDKKNTENRKLRPGPKADIFKIDGDWQSAMKKSLANRKPAGAWAK